MTKVSASYANRLEQDAVFFQLRAREAAYDAAYYLEHGETLAAIKYQHKAQAAARLAHNTLAELIGCEVISIKPTN